MRKSLLAVSTLIALLIVAIYIITCAIFYTGEQYRLQNDLWESSHSVVDFPVTLQFAEDNVTISKDKVCNISSNVTMPEFLLAPFSKGSMQFAASWNEDKLEEELEKLYRPVTDASINFDKISGWSLTEDESARSFSVTEVTAFIVSNDVAGETIVDMSEFMIKPTVTKGELAQKFAQLSVYNNFVAGYLAGCSISGNQMFSSFESPKDADLLSYDLSFIKEQLSSFYNTTGKTVDFRTSKGDTIQVTYKTYGKSVNWKKEEEFLKDAISTATPFNNREPFLSGYDNLTNTYVEVSLSDQHVWHYVEGELCCETDCVTGTKGRHDTPTGVYYISECIPGKYLTGDTYKTWVNQWMRLTNSGIGLHDAYWRGKFGSNIYTYNGSHGCINLPKDYASKLFKEVKNGYAVIIY